MSLSKQKIIDVLELQQPAALGDILESMVSVYEDTHHTNMTGRTPLPHFLRPVLGPPLYSLPSCAMLSQKHEHPERIAVRHKESGIDGLGEVIDVIHGDMRCVSAKIGRLFKPDIATRIPAGNFSASAFDPKEVPAKLLGVNEATVTLGTDGDLEIRSPDILFKSFMLGAAARSVLARHPDEVDLIKKSVGTLKATYSSSINLGGIVADAMKRSRKFKGKCLADYELAANIDKIATAFQNREGEFCDAYNFMYVVTQGKLDPHLQALRWAIEGTPMPHAGISIANSFDAAATLAGILELIPHEAPSREQALCEHMATATPQRAAILMDEANILDKIRQVIYDTEDPFKKGFIREVADQLKLFQDRHLVRRAWEHRIKTPGNRFIA